MSKSLQPSLEQERSRSKKSRSKGFYAVEDVLGHLIFVTWNLEEARQLSASMILSGKVQRNLIAIRRVPSSIVTAPTTESGFPVRIQPAPTQGTKITSSNSATTFTLGYYVEKHYNSTKLDMNTVRRIKIGNHYVTTAYLGRRKPKQTLQESSAQIVALWHPVSEVSESTEMSDPMSSYRLQCDKSFSIIGNSIRGARN